MIEHTISVLESATVRPGQMPGTSLTRVLLDHAVAKAMGMEVPDNGRQSSPAWCLMLGPQPNRMHQFYDWTIDGVVNRAAEVLLK